MVLELMAVRLLGPHFGQSQIVWTNVIGVVLAALALGQWFGGRWAERRSPAWASGALLAAAVLSWSLPDVVPWMAVQLLPPDLSLEEAAPFVSRGSLLVAIWALGLPLLALGVVTPWLVRLSREAEIRPGAVTGRLLGAGTLGSLIGTFGSTHVLLPEIGAAGAVRVAAVLLLLACLLLRAAGGRLPGSAALLLLLPMGAAALPVAPPLPGQLELVETFYQTARVVESEDGARWLRLNEGLDSFHSVRFPGKLLTGQYYDAFLLPSLLAAQEGVEVPEVLIVGLAAGTMATQLAQVLPQARVTGVELDAKLVDLGRRWFDLPDQVDVVTDLDGRIALEWSRECWDVVLVDAFSSQIYVPATLATREAFEALRDSLRPGGWAAVNISARGFDDPVARKVLGTFAGVFEGVRGLRVPGTRNLFVLGRSGGALPSSEAIGDSLRRAELFEPLAWLADESRWSDVEPLSGDAALRDRHAPVEELAHQAWSGDWAKQTRFVEVDPESRVDLALVAASAALRRTHWDEADAWLRLVESRRDLGAAERASLGLLAGNVAYERGDWEKAARAYRPLTAMKDVDEAVRAAAQENLGFVLQRLARSKELAGRATWLHAYNGLSAVIIALLFAFIIRRQPATGLAS